MGISNVQQRNYVVNNSNSLDVKNSKIETDNMPVLINKADSTDDYAVFPSDTKSYGGQNTNQVKYTTRNDDGFLAGLARKAGMNRLANFLRDDWAGETVKKIGLNGVADWLEDKDKSCTDGKDDGKLSFKESATSLAKGLLGGIPKTMINHPVTTALAFGFGAAAGGPGLLLMCALGLTVGIGTVGYSIYKASGAKTDIEKKMALETLGTGAATAVLSAASVNSALTAASDAGVQSAQVAKDANFGTKIIQTFKAVPESAKLSLKNLNFKYSLFASKELNEQGYVVQKNFSGGAYKKYNRGLSGTGRKILIEERTPSGVIKNYTTAKGLFCNKKVLVSELLPDKTCRIYDTKSGLFKDNSFISKETYTDGSYVRYNEKGMIIEEYCTGKPLQHNPFTGNTNQIEAWFERSQVSKPQKYLKKSINLSTKQVRKLSVSGSSVNGVKNIPSESRTQKDIIYKNAS